MYYTLLFFYGKKKKAGFKEKITRQEKDARSSEKGCKKSKI